MSERDACSLMVVADRKSSAFSSLRGKPGTFIIPAYSTGAVPPTAWVMSAVMDWLGSVLRSVQESPPSSETKMGAVALSEPPGFGVKAEAAMRRGFEAYSARNGSASCQLSPLSETGIKSTTRTPASLAGGFGTSRSDPLQATHRATPTVITLARIAHAPPGFAAARGSRQDNGSLVAGAVMRARNTIAVRTLQLEVPFMIDTGRVACSFFARRLNACARSSGRRASRA